MKRGYLWKEVTRKSYRVKRGDVVTFEDNHPDQIEGEGDEGFTVGGYASTRWSTIFEDYEERQPRLWIKITKSSDVPIRLALNKRFSTPLPLP
jgi:hypothetical protein